ncbi:MAG: methyltransferase [Bacteroidetes bacterium]|nr:methyltransferase [Bacteroidota bacterium]
MKVGTDGVLLGAWIEAKDSESILDIGTGCGLIALMLAQKSNARIIGIEIDESSAIQAKENVEDSKWHKRIEIINSSIQDFVKSTNEKFSLIVSNPPFFNESLKSPNPNKSLAKHADELPYSDLANSVYRLLSDDGRFYFILPYIEFQNFKNIALIEGLYISKITNVRAKENEKFKRVLAEFTKVKSPVLESEFSIRDLENQFTHEYLEITKDYYL